MTRVTVVVPTRNAARTLEACLTSIRAQSYPDTELVVVDNHSTDGTPEIAARYADQVLVAGPERSAQRNHGWRAGTGELVGFVDADMVLEPGVVADAVAVLSRDRGLGSLVVPEHAFGDGFLAGCRVLEKRIYLGDASVEAARFFRRSLLEELGGYDESLTAFEDWELADRLAGRGHGVGRTTAAIWHDEGRVSLRVAFTKKRYYGRWLPVYRARDARPLARPALLAKLPVGRHPVRSAGLLVLKCAELAGMALGTLDARRAR
ncbi:glycosyltransferase family 2 protein [Longispora albida]|uniref:glycosyltransferase family 2 protein n=1 Tax=Longispora albida TaxID=203523 RepID=UPI0003613D11|nr:glycosyltransferase family 2 protein [Longispora albida]